MLLVVTAYCGQINDDDDDNEYLRFEFCLSCFVLGLLMILCIFIISKLSCKAAVPILASLLMVI